MIYNYSGDEKIWKQCSNGSPLREGMGWETFLFHLLPVNTALIFSLCVYYFNNLRKWEKAMYTDFNVLVSCKNVITYL